MKSSTAKLDEGLNSEGSEFFGLRRRNERQVCVTLERFFHVENGVSWTRSERFRCRTRGKGRGRRGGKKKKMESEDVCSCAQQRVG